MTVNVAVGYGGRQEITDAVRALLAARARSRATLAEVAATLTAEDIATHLYTSGQLTRPRHPDLGEQRLSGFMLCAERPQRVLFLRGLLADFRRVDFLRSALVCRPPPPLRRLTGRPRRRPAAAPPVEG